MEGMEVMGGSDRDTLCLPSVYSLYRGLVIISYVVRNIGRRPFLPHCDCSRKAL